MDEELGVIENITRILTEFALTKLSAQALEVKGAVQEGKKYRWRIVSTRHKDVVVVLKARKPLFSKRIKLQAIQVFGTTQARKLKPNPADLQAYLEKAELVPV